MYIVRVKNLFTRFMIVDNQKRYAKWKGDEVLKNYKKKL